MRRGLALAGVVLAIAAALAAALASTATANQKKTINIAVFLASAANTYWEASLLGAKDVQKKNPNVKLTVFDGQFNTNKQLSQLRDALVSKKYDAWYVGPNDGGPLTQTIKQAIKSGVKVGCSLVPCGPDIRQAKVQIPGQTIFAGLGFYPNGQLLGKLVVQGCAGIDPCKVLWLPGLPTLPLEKARGDGLFSIIRPHSNIKVVATERFARSDTSVTGQALKLVSANPDAILVVASGSGAAMPEKGLVERGYKGKIYQTHAAATPDLVRIGGKDVEGTYVVSGPAIVAEQLPDNHPSKKASIDFVTRYEKANGPGSRNQFAGHSYDFQIVMEKIVPVALKKAKPGTQEFRNALRDATENMGRTIFSHGVMNWTKENHWGYTNETGVMLQVKDGKFVVVQ